MSSDYEPKKLVAPPCPTVSGTSKAWGARPPSPFPAVHWLWGSVRHLRL